MVAEGNNEYNKIMASHTAWLYCTLRTSQAENALLGQSVRGAEQISLTLHPQTILPPLLNCTHFTNPGHCRHSALAVGRRPFLAPLSKEEVQLIVIASAAVYALSHQRGANKVGFCMGAKENELNSFVGFIL